MKHPISGRIRRSPEEIQVLLAKFDRRPDSARHFALEQGIPPASFANWLRRREQTRAPRSRWVELQVPSCGAAQTPTVTIELANALKLQCSAGFPPTRLVELVRELRQL